MGARMFRQEVVSFNASTTHPGHYLCTYAAFGSVWVMVSMERV